MKKIEVAFHDKVLEAFDSNPGAESFHVTNDHQCFDRDSDAHAHQKELGGELKDVKLIRRKDVDDARALVNAPNAKDADKAKGANDGPRDLSEMKFKELQELCTESGYPEDEWKSFTSKADIAAYITSKTTPADK